MRDIFRKIFKRFEKWKKQQEIKNAVPKYLQGDKSKHRIHSTKYEDLCK